MLLLLFFFKKLFNQLHSAAVFLKRKLNLYVRCWRRKHRNMGLWGTKWR